jgi:hypothetical protein
LILSMTSTLKINDQNLSIKKLIEKTSPSPSEERYIHDTSSCLVVWEWECMPNADMS